MNTEGTLDYQIALEKRIARLYEGIASQFSSAENLHPEQATLWQNLARDEFDHAALLSIEKALLQTGTRVKKQVEIDPETRKKLEDLLADCEQKISLGISEAEAFEMLGAIESYDERLFKSLLKATDSKLLSRFASLSRSYKAHKARVKAGLKRYKTIRSGTSQLA